MNFVFRMPSFTCFFADLMWFNVQTSLKVYTFFITLIHYHRCLLNVLATQMIAVNSSKINYNKIMNFIIRTDLLRVCHSRGM